MKLTKITLEVGLPMHASHSVDNVEVRIDREEIGRISILINGCIREVTLTSEGAEMACWRAALDLLDRCWPNYDSNDDFNCSRAAYELAPMEEIHCLATTIRKIAGV
ncbi:MAG: DUF1439 domain-containing protein [Myxococcales bacterium]|nr:DUF1439 domain-containing protein [Myxococcales bacterium]